MNIPKVAWLTVNRACNLRCQWCYGTSLGFASESEMDYETAKNIVLLLKDVGVESIVLIGGEPTLWKDLFRFNDFCNSLPIKTNIVTNCYKFHSEHFWLQYQQHPNSRIEPSLKAFDERSSLLITKSREFEKVRVGMRRAAGESKTMINVVYSTLIEGNLLEMVSAAVDLGAYSVRIGVCKPMSIGGKFAAPFTVPFGRMASEITSNYAKMVDITKGRLSFALSTPFCVWPADFIQDGIAHKRIGVGGCQFQKHSGVVFDTDGTVVLCNTMFECPVGKYGVDFNDSLSFLAMINGEKVNSIYRHISSYPSEECIGCDFFQECQGGCPIMWTVYNPNGIVHSIKKGGE
ncbi:MAG: radical SAM protein [Candidatus Kaiserbacteria bacterium]|nr:radical SAM protein [Candidatus Kaiserbacteria bacterium]